MRLAIHSLAAAASLALALASPALCRADNGADDPSAGGGGSDTITGADTVTGADTATGNDTVTATGADTLTAGGGADVITSLPPPPKKPKKSAGPPLAPEHVIWCAPGHPDYAIGDMLHLDAEDADGYRAAGKARRCTDAEVAEYQKHGRRIHDLVTDAGDGE